MTRKRELLKEELDRFNWGDKSDQWYKNLILLMAEILTEEQR